MVSDVKNKIIKSRSRKTGVSQVSAAPNSADFSDQYIKEKDVFSDIENSSSWMANAVLDCVLEVLGDDEFDFEIARQSFRRSFRRLLLSVSTRQEQVIFLHEAVPAFTALCVKKDNWGEVLSKTKKSKKPAKSPTSKATTSENFIEAEAERKNAVECIIGAYVGRTGNRVLCIESSDLTCVLFPVEDMRQNLREMGFWGV